MFSVTQLGITDYKPESVGWGDMGRCMATVESMTPETGWALGEHFTTADVVFGGTLDFSIQFGWLEKPSPKVAAYVERIKGTPRLPRDPSRIVVSMTMSVSSSTSRTWASDALRTTSRPP